ncbi:hypothetical protein [Zoogloea sp.]|uniref:hypothetical protein n=1 Tax=Zoogloea sp. TaxID=49181 RepID=UPI0025EE2CC2|nr:hypothetical protein [Zoogloea sp.]MCK6396002.1 hypothetical protein [Zoogloea sp.]
METLKILLPLLGVLLGALISGFSNILKYRTERRKIVAMALADLLEVRHHLAGVNVVLKELNQRFTVPAEISIHLQAAIEQLAPIDADVHKRYEAAVTLLAGIDPLLGFTLRSKNSLPKFINSIRGLAEENGISLGTVSQISDLLRTSLLPKLDAAVVELAGQHSWLTKRKVVKHIARSGELPPEVIALFDQFAAISKAPKEEKPPATSEG